jgi:hypothetical protein
MDEAFLARNALNASLGFSGDMRTTALITNGEIEYSGVWTVSKSMATTTYMQVS